MREGTGREREKGNSGKGGERRGRKRKGEKGIEGERRWMK